MNESGRTPDPALEDLARARRELEAAYEELRSTTTELEATNRELQSTNDALEKTNGALVSSNDEVDTLSGELRVTNEELLTTNDLLRERTQETLLAQSLLDSVLSSIPHGLVVVDRALRIITVSRHAADLWGLQVDEVEGEDLLSLDGGIPVQSLRDPIDRVLAGEQVTDFALDCHDRRGKPVHVRIGVAPLQLLPEAGSPDGAILLVSAEPSD